jgi:hypothetical protein
MTNDIGQPPRGTAALYCIFGDTSWLEQSYHSVYPCVEKIFFFLSSSPWYGSAHASEVDPQALALLPDPQKKVETISGDWKSETDQRNYTLAYAQAHGYEYGLIIDADEVYDSAQLTNAISLAHQQRDVAVWHMNWFTYWRSPDYRIDPIEPYQPPILIHLGYAAFVETRNAIGAKHELIPPTTCMCHHLSYALTDEALRRKHIMQPGHSQSAYPEWYESKWCAWLQDPNLTNLHPVHPPWFERAVRQPEELKPSVLRRN